MKTLTRLNLCENYNTMCCPEVGMAAKNSEAKLMGDACFIDSEIPENSMSYKGRIEIQLNEEEIKQIEVIAQAALARASSEVKAAPAEGEEYR